MDVNAIARILRQPSVRAVSFDIFDTLLERPALRPDDIFVLLNEPVRELLQRPHFNFHRARKTIEQEAVQHHASGNQPPAYTLTFAEIHAFFQKKYKLTDSQMQAIMALERDLEERLLAPRACGRQIFDAARTAGKHILCISDMYHDPAWLHTILERNGFAGIDAIYVSAEVRKRKDSGELFRHVLASEQLAPHELLHIGDNPESDYRIPLALGIPALHLPSSLQQFLDGPLAKDRVWKNACSPQEGLLIGFYLNQWSAQQSNPTSRFTDKHKIGYFGLGPLLFGTAQALRTTAGLQHYPCIHFASRDGFLPMQAYQLLQAENTQARLPARYLYCGRALYHATRYRGNPLQYLTRRLQKEWCGPDMTLGHLFDALVAPEFLAADDPRRSRRVTTEIEEKFRVLRAIVTQHHAAIDQRLREKQDRLATYYKQNMVFSPDQRALAFDCGCGGSVSTRIMPVVTGRIDKVYLWETARNRLADRWYRTRTHLLCGDLHDLQPMGALSIFEEVFAAPQGPCIDVRKEADRWVAITDPALAPDADTIRALQEIQAAALDFVRDIQKRFGSLLDRLSLQRIAFTTEPLLACLQDPVDQSIRHFEHIVFPDAFYGDARPLSEKIEPVDRDHLLRTPFVDPALTISQPPPADTIAPLRIGLQLHLYHLDMAADFHQRLERWQMPFDLFVSVCRPADEAIVRTLFMPLLEQKGGKLVVRILPNRGRDTGAWLAGFGQELAAYDLAGHVHAKRSPHFAWGDQWRDYLLDNVIGWDAFRDIATHFANDSALGLLFPPLYDELFAFWGNENLTHLEESDRRHCQDLLQRMGIPARITKHNLHFSAGTMFWYRPAALAPLCNLGLTFEDFEPEPVGITGSLAHAIERLPAIVAEHSGFTHRAYISQAALIETFHRHQRHLIGANQGSLPKPWRDKAVSSLAQILLPLLPRGTRRYRLAQALARHILPGWVPS